MKAYLFQSIRLTLTFVLLFMVVYPTLIWTISMVSEGQGKGLKTENHFSNMGQKFDTDELFNSRPSAAEYNAAGSCGSNKGNANPAYLKIVSNRIDSFLVHNPTIKRSQIPSDLVTASGSGLDPHISVEAARVQVPRIARKRSISEAKLNALIKRLTEKPFLGLFGPEKINVLTLNLAVQKISRK